MTPLIGKFWSEFYLVSSRVFALLYSCKKKEFYLVRCCPLMQMLDVTIEKEAPSAISLIIFLVVAVYTRT
jgi:hypothetical protein